MSKILLPDKVRAITDDEVEIGDSVLVGTWLDISNNLSYLNFYARIVVPFHQWATEQRAVEFVYPGTGANYAQRKLGVFIALSPAEFGPELPVTVTVSGTSGSGNHKTIQSSNVPSLWSKNSEEWVQFLFIDVGIIPDSRELITVSTDLAFSQIVGVGAWELPPTGTGALPMVGPGLTIGTGSIDPALDPVILDPSDFLSNDYIDDVALAEVQTSMEAAWQHNRRVIFWGEFEGFWELDTDPAGVPKHAINTAYSYPTGGIAIPPYGYSKQQELAGSRNIRIVLKVAIVNNPCELRFTTSIGSTAWQNMVVGIYWWPTWNFVGGFYDRLQNGILVPVGFAFEWIYAEMRSANANTQMHISSMVIWEDEP